MPNIHVCSTAKYLVLYDWRLIQKQFILSSEVLFVLTIVSSCRMDWLMDWTVSLTGFYDN